MSDSADGDVVMFFEHKRGQKGIPAESRSALTGSGTKLMEGFEAGRYFEVEDFTFGIALADDEGGDRSGQADQRSYSRWRGLKENQPKPTPPFRADPRDVTLTRQIDSASPKLLEHCLNSEQFFRVVLVKRSRVGGTGILAGILRMEFENVWIKALEWTDGDAVKESCTFRFQSVQVTYVSRNEDGSVAKQWACGWKGI